jgi:hypothetical protein
LLARHGSVARAIRATSDFDSALIEQLRQIFQPLTDSEVVAIHLRGYASLSLPDVATPSHWRARDPELSAHTDLAVAFVASALGDVLSWPSLQSGRVLNDVLVVDNKVAAHGRPGFKATNDGQDRWLRKALVLRRDREPEKGAIL